jgi:hypothetical protein
MQGPLPHDSSVMMRGLAWQRVQHYDRGRVALR